MANSEFIAIDLGEGLRLDVAPGTSILEACNTEGVQIAHACKGHTKCTTCRVSVESGAVDCPPASSEEVEALGVNGLAPPVRLACQLRPTGDVSVRILIPCHDCPEHNFPEAAEEEIAVLFTDIRGFTGFAEGRLPFDVCSVLNRYFDFAGILVERHEGMILNYLGDGVLTIFRPSSEEDPRRRAVRCGLEILRASHDFRKYVQDTFDADLRIGVAIHAGPVVVGELGFFRNRQLNAIGDAVNVAARLEDFNKECGTDFLISKHVADACGDEIRTGRSFELDLRGRSESVTALEVLGDASPSI